MNSSPLLYSAVFSILFTCLVTFAAGQGVGINGTGSTPDPSSGIDVNFTDRGALIPRMTTAQRDAIVNPAQALQIYNTTTRCFEFWEYGMWQTMVCASCPIPIQPGAITGNSVVCENESESYSVPNSDGITYTWVFPAGWVQTSGGTSNSITATVGPGAGNIQVTPSNVCGNGAPQTLSITVDAAPAPPSSSTHSSLATQITWNWNPVSSAAGYQWNTSATYPGAGVNVVASPTFTQLSLTCDTNYNLYVWSYNACGVSGSTTLTQTTSSCSFPCGSTLPVTHNTSDGVSPVNKSVTYGTISFNGKCWTDRNLGANNIPGSATDATEAASGWYWQFNRKQGYMHNGSSPTPAWTITAINENSNWTVGNDPCALMLGSGWHVPTVSEWTSFHTTPTGSGGMGSGNLNNAFGSALKLHGAGEIFNPSSPTLDYRGERGYYWSSSQESNTIASLIYFTNINPTHSGVTGFTNNKPRGKPLRCITN